MPTLSLPLVSLESSVDNPIFFSVAEDVQKALCIGDDTQLIIYNSLESGRTDVARENIKHNDKKNLGEFESKRRIEVRISEEEDENSLGTGYLHSLDTFPFFRDTDIGVSVTPEYIVKNYDMEFTITSPSKVEINQLRDLLRHNLTKTINILQHQVEYTMILPPEFDDFVDDVYERKNRLYPIDRIDYFKRMATNRIHLITGLKGTENMLFAVKEIQERIFGTFDFTNSPNKADNNNDNNSHVLTFNYYFTMEVPRRFSMQFPVMICNKVMKTKYLKIINENAKKRYDFYTNKNLNLGRSASIMQSKFSGEAMQLASSLPNYPINIPIFDEYFESKGRNRGYATIMTVLCKVNEEDKRSLINLRDDLKPWYIPEKILNYIHGKGRRKVFHPNAAFIYICIEQMGKHLSNMILEMDDDFNLKSSKELELMKPVRISIKVSIDPTFIMLPGQEDFEKDDDLLETVLEEYIELKDKFDNNDDHEEGRILYIIHLIIKKYDQYVRVGKCKEVRRFARVIMKDDILAYRLGEMLVKGFPIITQAIRGCGVFINRHGKIDIFDEDDITRTEQEKGEGTNREEMVGDNGDYDFQVRHRSTMHPSMSRTVMNSCVVALRRE